MRLDDKKWREFYLSELGFQNYHGKRLVKNKRIKGKIPLLTAGETNNGVADFISNDMKIFKDVISVDMFGNSFYHNYYCCGDDNIYFFENDDLNEYIKLFITKMINNNKIKFSYGRQFRQHDADKLKILLPIDKNNQPDYKFMEDYTKFIINQKREKYINYIKEKLKSIEYKPIKDLKDKEWGEFRIYDIFQHQRGKRQTEQYRKKGNIPYYSASKDNNGLTDFISNPKFIIKTEAIIYSTFGDAYFVEKNFSTSDEITILTNSYINRYNGLFIVQALKQNKQKYSFGRKAFSNKIGKDKILLPIDKNNQPDYEYMEQYIKNMMYKKINRYLNYLKNCYNTKNF